MVALWKKREEELSRLRTFGPQEVDDRPGIHGVLLGGEIERLARQHRLITPFNRAHLKPAAYHLTVGNEYFLGGEYFTLKDDDWPAPGSEDTELGVFMGPEVSHGATKVYAGIQT